MNRSIIRLTALAATAAGALAFGAVTAPAVVPPRNCHQIKHGDLRYLVQVDQITCRSGARFAQTYLRTRRAPRGYDCQRYGIRANRISFRCNDGKKLFQTIRCPRRPKTNSPCFRR